MEFTSCNPYSTKGMGIMRIVTLSAYGLKSYFLKPQDFLYGLRITYQMHLDTLLKMSMKSLNSCYQGAFQRIRSVF